VVVGVRSVPLFTGIGVRTFPFLPRNSLGSIWPLKALTQEGEGTNVGTFTLAYLLHPHEILWYLCPRLHCFYCLRNPNRVDWAPTQGLWRTLHSYRSNPPPKARDNLKVTLSLPCLWVSFHPQTPLSVISAK